ncbi:glycosyltransferase [Bosea sp. (in: a-proteobacteria)]|uniref:glycosyltransferase n=1 Tax=Bosea sp. (in: a-proteobacteria) TaxID=1871050 RepID=UPI003F71D89B
MRILMACEFYHPSRGGVQEVMRQLAERFVAAGHEVTVCTTRLPDRSFKTHNGVTIEEFDITGNRANGMHGEIQRYVDYLSAFDGDAILIKAAQQWTFDASWDALDHIKARKVFIPCGFSGLYEPAYREYFQQLPNILRKWDHLIFYAESYRDIDFARAHQLERRSFLPNGASEFEFNSAPPPGIRARLGISDDALLVMTVGSPINAKGHTELAQAFARLDPKGRTLALLLNGNWPQPPAPPIAKASESAAEEAVGSGSEERPLVIPNDVRADQAQRRSLADIGGKAIDTLQRLGIRAFLSRAAAWLYHRSLGVSRKLLSPVLSAYAAATDRLRRALQPHVQLPLPPPLPLRQKTVDDYVDDIASQPNKIVLKTNLPREELIAALFSADLFVFASNVEYSPLVLFEACAAGLPFLTVPVGNSEEIVRWTGGGELCPAEKDERGYTRADPAALADRIQDLLDAPERRHQLGMAGRRAWEANYNWGAIAPRYEAILRGEGSPAGEAAGPAAGTETRKAQA